MAWINLEITGDGSKVKDIKDVWIMADVDDNVMLFETSAEADYYCSTQAEQGKTYSTIEIWG